MAKKKRRKRIAGVKVPKRFRGAAAGLDQMVRKRIVPDLIATAIAAGAAAVIRSTIARRLASDLRHRVHGLLPSSERAEVAQPRTRDA